MMSNSRGLFTQRPSRDGDCVGLDLAWYWILHYMITPKLLTLHFSSPFVHQLINRSCLAPPLCQDTSCQLGPSSAEIRELRDLFSDDILQWSAISVNIINLQAKYLFDVQIFSQLMLYSLRRSNSYFVLESLMMIMLFYLSFWSVWNIFQFHISANK